MKINAFGCASAQWFFFLPDSKPANQFSDLELSLSNRCKLIIISLMVHLVAQLISVGLSYKQKIQLPSDHFEGEREKTKWKTMRPILNSQKVRAAIFLIWIKHLKFQTWKCWCRLQAATTTAAKCAVQVSLLSENDQLIKLLAFPFHSYTSFMHSHRTMLLLLQQSHKNFISNRLALHSRCCHKSKMWSTSP